MTPVVVFTLTTFQLQSRPRCTAKTSNKHIAFASFQVLGVKGNEARITYFCTECLRELQKILPSVTHPCLSPISQIDKEEVA
jgi:hypothetical protein